MEHNHRGDYISSSTEKRCPLKYVGCGKCQQERCYEPLWLGLLLWDHSAKQTLEQGTNQDVQQPQEATSAEYDEQADHQNRAKAVMEPY